MQLELFLRMMQLQLMGSLTRGDSLGDIRGDVRDNSFALLLAMAMAGSPGGGEGGTAVSPAAHTGNGQNEIKSRQSRHPVKTEGQPRQEGQPVSSPPKKMGEGINSLISGVADKYNLDPALLKAVVKVESHFNPRAVSPAGAMGLMQLMPKTAAALGVKDAFNVQENLEGGARYLKSMLDRFRGDVNLALAAYNAGPGAVKKYGGVPPYRETMEYVRRVKESRKEFVV